MHVWLVPVGCTSQLYVRNVVPEGKGEMRFNGSSVHGYFVFCLLNNNNLTTISFACVNNRILVEACAVICKFMFHWRSCHEMYVYGNGGKMKT